MTALLAPVGGQDAVVPVPHTAPCAHDRHAWYPTSPCGTDCLDSPEAQAGLVVQCARVLRLLMVLSTIAVGGLLVAPMPRVARRTFLRSSARQVLRAIGIRVVVDDHRPFGSRTRGLVVANHISYLDILAIAVVQPARFVAKSDVADMPGISLLAKRFGVIHIDRGSLRGLPAVVRAATTGLCDDASVAVFPEGTTWCGHAQGSFRPAFFQSALDAGVPVLPMGIAFSAFGARCSAPGFIGDDGPADTLRRVLGLRGLAVHVSLHEPQLPHGDRGTLAARCELMIRSTSGSLR